MGCVVPLLQEISVFLIVLVDEAPLAVIVLWWVVPQSVKDLGVALGIGECWALVHHLQCVKQSEHHT